MLWAFVGATGTGFLVLDDMIADKSSRMNSEEYWAIVSAQIQPNTSKLIGLTVQGDNNPKHHLKATQVIL